MYLARDMELGTFWAIKQLPLSMKKEAELLRRLNHSSLPRMTDYTEQDDKCYLVMEYIKGKSLNEYLKTNNLLSFEEILTITRTILRIFQYLHSQKPPIYYGDLKPENLMRTETRYGKYLQEMEKPNLERVGSMIQENVHRALMRQNPYSAACLEVYLYRKEQEVHRIITAMECVRYGLPAEKIREYLA